MPGPMDINDLIDNIRDELPTRVHDAFNEAVERVATQGREQRRHVARQMMDRNPWVRAERRRQRQRTTVFSLLMLVVGVVGGAAVMYLFDPERGKRRRALLRDQADSAFDEVSDSLEGRARDAVNRVENAVHDAQPGQAQNAGVSDFTLQTRVQAQLGHYVADPGAISVAVNGGNVILGGKIHAREAQPLIERVRTIPGVKSVENRLELHDSGENVPNPQAGSNGNGIH